MNATFRVAVKACLLTAVSGVLLNQVVGLSAQDVGGQQSDGSAAPTIRRTAGYQGAAMPAPQTSAAESSSAVQQQLQELYRKNGREMPSMNMADLPNVQPQPPASPAAGQYAPAKPMNSSAAKSGSPDAKSQKPNFFERLFRIGRARKKPAVTAQPVRPAAPVAQPRQYTPPQIASRPAAPLSQPPVASASPGPRAAAQPPVREPTLLDGSGAAMSRANRTPASISRPTQRSGISPPMTDDDEDSTSDSESLDLDQDDHAQNSDEAPQILSSQTANGPADSPYSGHKLSPLDMEQKAAAAPKADGESADSTTDDDADDAADSEEKPARSEPAPLAPAADKAPAASPDRTQADDSGMKDKEELDLEEEEEPLTLPADQPAKPAERPAAPPAEKPALPATEKPPKEKVLEKPASEKETQKPAGPALVKGFRGYCPVALKDSRKLLEAKPEIESTYRDKVYTFSSYQAKEAFDLNPKKYVPAGAGADVVCRAGGETDVEGSLEHAAWYRGRLYLFSSADTRREFVETPSKFIAED